MSVALNALSLRAARTMTSAVRNASVSSSMGRMARAAALRSTATARAVVVRHGTTRRFARALTADDGHQAMVAKSPTGSGRNIATVQRVEIRWTFQRRPINADIDDLSQSTSKGVGQFGKLACYRRCARPPRSVEVVAQFGRQGEADRAGQAPYASRAAHGAVVVATGTAGAPWPWSARCRAGPEHVVVAEIGGFTRGSVDKSV